MHTAVKISKHPTSMMDLKIKDEIANCSYTEKAAVATIDKPSKGLETAESLDSEKKPCVLQGSPDPQSQKAISIQTLQAQLLEVQASHDIDRANWLQTQAQLRQEVTAGVRQLAAAQQALKEARALNERLRNALAVSGRKLTELMSKHLRTMKVNHRLKMRFYKARDIEEKLVEVLDNLSQSVCELDTEVIDFEDDE